MRFLLNILWFVCGGFISWLQLVITGLLLCVTVIGIPFGIQCFKLAGIAASPFGKEIAYNGGVTSLVGNVLWIILVGWETALLNMIIGIILCVTIIGIPWGKQFFKIASVSFMPFGSEVRLAHVF